MVYMLTQLLSVPQSWSSVASVVIHFHRRALRPRQIVTFDHQRRHPRICRPYLHREEVCGPKSNNSWRKESVIAVFLAVANLLSEVRHDIAPKQLVGDTNADDTMML